MEQEGETVPPPDSQASAGLSQWQNGRFLCLCLFLSPAVTLRRVAIVSCIECRRSGAAPSLALPLSRPRCPAQGGELEERAGGQAPNRAGHTYTNQRCSQTTGC